MRCLAVLLICGGVAGCGGGPIANSPPPLTTAERLGLFADLSDQASELDVLFNAPTSGSAVYAGLATLVMDPDASAPVFLIGDVAIEANFSNLSFLGAIERLTDTATNDLIGELDLLEGTIAISGLEARLSGELSLPAATFDVDGGFRGAFLGANAEMIAGLAEAGLRSDGDFVGTVSGAIFTQLP